MYKALKKNIVKIPTESLIKMTEFSFQDMDTWKLF
jgi:hypothetical protein